MLSLLVIFTGLNEVYAQTSKKEERVRKAAAIKQMVSSKDFVFKAQFALPMGGSSFQLTSEYDVQVKKDTVICFLPYFGRAYTAPMNPSEGGIRFTSKDFQYTVSNKKKSGWDIVIKPRDVNNIQQLTFYISESGYGSVQVTDNNRQPISFNGYFEKNKEENKKE
ncbi:DUF4251 domain-containing protein [Arcticibacter tournemirensis]|uniref:DUF4251 domain-containing protein n=2 Tax=Arcticibacter tournemirensis TaxID=699437 RepID=A0A4Q0MDE2_9SPHI|nr:DUF4251 domain-containing protein [Arcticibacter tournemirensis]